MKANYSKWRKRLAGETVVAFTEPDENDVGFYRLPIRQKLPNGRWEVLGWKPVALFMAVDDEMTGSELVARIGDRNAPLNHLNEQWPWFVKHPITEDLYRAVTERNEPWPDFPPADAVPAANRDVTASDNAEPEEPLDIQHATAIDNAIAAAIKKVTNETEAAQALGSKNRIAELRLLADKAGKAIYEPIYRTYTAEQKKWSPIVKRAETAEKSLNTAILTFRETERRQIAAEQAEADRKQREIDEANARAADRAIAKGEPEPMPAINMPPYINQHGSPYRTPIEPTYGTRGLKEEVKTFLDQVTSWDMLFAHFKANGEVQALLTKLASAEIKAGRAVPGTTTREGLI